jgi:hypothetical protein
MKTKFSLKLLAALLLLPTLNSQLSTALAQGTAFTYQGRLASGTNAANGNFDLSFSLYSTNFGGGSLAGMTNSAVNISNGFFTVSLDFGNGIFTGPPRWLEIAVRSNAFSAFTTLSPRQLLTPTPYALYAPTAGGVPSGAISNSQLAVASVSGTNLQPGSVTGPTIASNQVVKSLNGLKDNITLSAGPNVSLSTNGNSLQVNASGTIGWGLNGNTGTAPGTNFFGTTDNQPLEFRVNNSRALRLEPDAGGAASLVGGASINFVAPGIVGATIAGGGSSNYFGAGYTNSVAGDFGVIGGGNGNSIQLGRGTTIAGGSQNSVGTNSGGSTIAGGINNSVAALAGGSTIAGGVFNQVELSAASATIAGGYNNDVGSGAAYSTIGGGQVNAVTGSYATVPGGQHNWAAGNSSFAAGQYGQAMHNGAFVWSDATSATAFSSTAANQFLIRAGGGVGIGTNNPQSLLHVTGTVTANAFNGSGAGLLNIPAANLTGIIPDTSLSTNVPHSDDGNNIDFLQIAHFKIVRPCPGEAIVTFDATNGCDNWLAFTKSGTETWDIHDNEEDDFVIYSPDGPYGNNRISLPYATADVVLVPNAGSVGIGTESPKGALQVASGGLVVTGHTTSNAGPGSFAQAGPGIFMEYNSAGAQGSLFAYDYTANTPLPLALNASGGTVSVPVLLITGGSDLAEPFQLSGFDVPKGALVIIDEENPGKLKLCDRAYDTRLAGIVSGANGIKPGISLRQEGALGSGENVALSGRVYALADASKAPIKPGDLLTSSAIPGHCMKVTDYGKAQGAIIGKAMSSLGKGQGMVLVLVSLQ